MSNYRRLYAPNGTYFFTVVTHNRTPLFADPNNVERLRRALAYATSRLPFSTPALVILPDHLHCVWTMSADKDFSKRWWMIKTHFARSLNRETGRRAQAIWQNRFWEHLVRDPDDLHRHLDYIHYNPVKHGHAARPLDWTHSSFRDFVARGLYDKDWGNSEPKGIHGLDFE